MKLRADIEGLRYYVIDTHQDIVVFLYNGILFSNYGACFTILNSTGGHIVSTVSPIHFYCATKFAITAIAEGVRQELREMKSNCRATVSIISLLILDISCSLSRLVW